MRSFQMEFSPGFADKLSSLNNRKVSIWMAGHLEYVLERVNVKSTIGSYFFRPGPELLTSPFETLPERSELRISEVEDNEGATAAYLYGYFDSVTRTLLIHDFTLILGAPPFIELRKAEDTIRIGEEITRRRYEHASFDSIFSRGFNRDLDGFGPVEEDQILVFLKERQKKSRQRYEWSHFKPSTENVNLFSPFNVSEHRYLSCTFPLEETYGMPVEIIACIQDGEQLLLSCKVSTPSSKSKEMEPAIFSNLIYRRSSHFAMTEKAGMEKIGKIGNIGNVKIFKRIREGEVPMFLEDLYQFPDKLKKKFLKKLKYGARSSFTSMSEFSGLTFSRHNLEKLEVQPYLDMGVSLSRRVPPRFLDLWLLPQKTPNGDQYFCAIGYLRESTLTVYRCLEIKLGESIPWDMVQSSLRLYEIDEMLKSGY